MLGLAKRVGARLETTCPSLCCILFINIILVLFIACNNGYRILLTSTSEVYGDPLVHPQEESYWGNVNPIGIFAVIFLCNLRLLWQAEQSYFSCENVFMGFC